LASQRSSMMAWDKETGEPLSPVLSWQDRRTAAWLERFQSQNKLIKEKTGIPLSPHYGGGKLRWLLDNVPAVQKAAREKRLAFGPLASFFIFHLLSERSLQVDHATAGRTQLWNIDTRDWDPWLLSLFELPGDALPKCRPTSYEYGLLKAAEIPLTSANGDQNAAIYGLGQPPPKTGIVNLGTGAFILALTGERRIHHPTLLCGLASSEAEKGEYTLEGTVNGAGSALSWAADAWKMPDITERLADWLARPEEPPLFINTIGGLGSPWWRNGPPPYIVGDGEPWQHAVAVIESILFLLQANIVAMLEAGLKFERFQVGGGIAQLDGLCQMLADLTGTVVYRPVEKEATTRGAAWLAAGRPKWPETKPGQTFNPQPNPALVNRYQHFLEELTAAIH
jgi:glycerol kinase